MLAHSEFKLNQPSLNCAAAKVTFGAASGCSKKKCSDFDETGGNQPESIKCGANLVSDEKVDFSQKNLCDTIPVFYSAPPQVIMREVTVQIMRE